MKIKTNQVGRKYGEIVFKELTIDDKEKDLWIKRKMHVYRWKEGDITLQIDGLSVAIIKEKELVECLKRLPKNA